MAGVADCEVDCRRRWRRERNVPITIFDIYRQVLLRCRYTHMNVSLTPELEALVNEKVRSGLYHTASEVVREALRLLKNRDDEVQRAERQAMLPPASVRSRQGSGRKPRSRARSPMKRG